MILARVSVNFLDLKIPAKVSANFTTLKLPILALRRVSKRFLCPYVPAPAQHTYYVGKAAAQDNGLSERRIVGKAAAQDNGLSERRILTGLLLLKSSRS